MPKGRKEPQAEKLLQMEPILGYSLLHREINGNLISLGQTVVGKFCEKCLWHRWEVGDNRRIKPKAEKQLGVCGGGHNTPNPALTQ